MKDQSQVMKQNPQPPQMMTQQPQPQMMSHHPQLMMTQQPQPQMLTQRTFGMWPPPAPLNYPNPLNPQNPQGFVGTKTRNWKGKKGNNNLNKGNVLAGSGGSSSSVKGGGGGYRPPTLNELQHQNRMKARRFFNPKKKSNYRFAPYAPRNTTSFLIRAKKSGGIASLVSPCPVTPAVLPTPMFSPSREVLGDTAKEEWGVDGYGSMKGLIRLRSPGGDHEDDEEGDSSSDSDVEEHVEVERRLDHDLSRFEMIYPSYGGVDYNNVLENRVDDQDTHIAHLEEENLILKERLFLMEREVGDLRRRMQYLERRNGHVAEEINEEVVDNVSENDSESRDDGHSMDGHKYNEDENRDVGGEEVEGKQQQGSYGAPEEDCARDACMNEFVNEIKENVNEDMLKDQQDGDCCVEKSSKINDDISMVGETSLQAGVAAGEDELKELED